MSTKEWYILADGKEQGPTDAASLRRLAIQGKIDPASMVRKGSGDKWVPASKVKGLFEPSRKAIQPKERAAETTEKVADDDVLSWIENGPPPSPTPQVQASSSVEPKPASPPKAQSPLPQPIAEVIVEEVDSKSCPFCGEQIKRVAKKCKHCGEFLDTGTGPTQAHQPHDQDWNPGVAAVLNIIPGVGYIYMGRVGYGLMNLFAGPFIYSVLWGVSFLSFSLAGAAATTDDVAGIIILIFMIIGGVSFLLPIAGHIRTIYDPIGIAKKQATHRQGVEHAAD